MICTFFGHRDCSSEIAEELRALLIDLIENKGVDCFYVGNQGRFDRIVQGELRKLKKFYSISCYVVLAYLPVQDPGIEELECFLPEGIEGVFPRFAIDWRNRWMLEQAEYVVCYAYKSFGGAAKFLKLANQKNKTVMNLGS